MTAAQEKLIAEKAEIIRLEFISAMTRKLKSGGIDASSINNDHGSNGLAPVTVSTLRELTSQEESMLTTTGKKDANNLDCF